MSETILSVKDLSISLSQPQKDLTTNVSFEIRSGEIFALVGESGSGKTISAMAIAGMYPQPNGYKSKGEISFYGNRVDGISDKEWCEIRGKDLTMIFQEPSAALNPLMKIGKQISEYKAYHEDFSESRVVELLKRVGFDKPDRILNSWPHELSGGMQQRIMIAMALLMKPKLLIADEPTTALDVTIQSQIMDLLIELQEEVGTSILFITHNLALVAQYADRLAVMKDGVIVEEKNVFEFFENPEHEYSKDLLASVPVLEGLK